MGFNPYDEVSSEVHEAERQLKVAQQNLANAKRRQEVLQSNCSHRWEEKYTPEVTEAYTIPGDTPGTMGVDFRGPTYVPRQVTPKWTRYCEICHKRVETTQTTVKTVEGPKW